jgi:prepilin-type processing-associated H-X9-DG protein
MFEYIINILHSLSNFIVNILFCDGEKLLKEYGGIDDDKVN